MTVPESFDERLKAFAAYKYDWDERGSAPPSGHAIATARCLTPVPLSGGGLQLVLMAGGMEIEIEIDATGRIVSVLSAAA